MNLLYIFSFYLFSSPGPDSNDLTQTEDREAFTKAFEEGMDTLVANLDENLKEIHERPFLLND